MTPETRLALARLTVSHEAMLTKFRASMSPKDYLNHKWILDQAKTAMEAENRREPS